MKGDISKTGFFHFDFVGGCVLKNQVVINQIKNPIFTGMFE